MERGGVNNVEPRDEEATCFECLGMNEGVAGQKWSMELGVLM
jgi:hypothetical protein